MPPSKLLPELIKAIAISKPNRDSWLVEELLDAFLIWDESVRIERTRFPGVLLVLSRKLDPITLSKLAMRTTFSFMSRLIPAVTIVEIGTINELAGILERLLREEKIRELNTMITIRGEGKRIASESMIKNIIANMNYTVKKDAKRVIAIESIDELFTIAIGTIKTCGLECKLLIVS